MIKATETCLVPRPLRWQAIRYGGGSQWRERAYRESAQAVKLGRLPPNKTSLLIEKDMKNNFKIVEIRDRATFIPALAMRMVPENDLQKVLFQQIGYRSSSNPCILLMSLEAPWHSARSSDEWQERSGRTMSVAHQWIEKHYDSIVDCQVVDVEYILGEVEHPCLSYRDEKIKEALDTCDNEDEKAKMSSMLWATGIITSPEYLTKYAHWKCWVCKEKRADEFISVKVHDVSLEQGFEREGMSLVNVKYCNDRKDCTEMALHKLNWIKI